MEELATTAADLHDRLRQIDQASTIRLPKPLPPGPVGYRTARIDGIHSQVLYSPSSSDQVLSLFNPGERVPPVDMPPGLYTPPTPSRAPTRFSSNKHRAGVQPSPVSSSHLKNQEINRETFVFSNSLRSESRS